MEERIYSTIDNKNVAYVGSILGTLFLSDPRDEQMSELINSLANIDLASEWPFGDPDKLIAIALLIASGAHESSEQQADEYKRLFIGPGHFEAPAWGSVYLDSDEIVFGNSELDLRHWMRTHGIEHVVEGGRHPYDHIGLMLVLMGWLAENKPELLTEYLGDHLMPWAPRYLELLEQSSRQALYKGLAQLTSETLTAICTNLHVVIASRNLFH